ncbi:hypothetical protein HKD37_15G043065 [Glycine soja]
MQSQFQSQMQSHGLTLPSEPKVSPSGARVSTKESCVDPSGNDPETGDSDKCRLYIEENPSRLVGVEEVKDAEAPVPVPTDEVTLVGQILKTFLAWPTHLVKHLSEQAVVSPAKPPKSLDHEVDDPLHLTETSMRAGNSDVYGFLEPQSIQRSGQSQFESKSYIKSWIGHWQMVVILPKENLVVWFCSLHNRPDNYLKGIINSALKGLDDTPEPKSKAAARWIVVKCNRQKGSTERDYYVMHWMSTIISGTFRNNWETYFNDVRPLEEEIFKALQIQWAQYYLKVRNQT